MSVDTSIIILDYTTLQLPGICILLNASWSTDPVTFNASAILTDSVEVATEQAPATQYSSSLVLGDSVSITKLYTFYTMNLFNDVVASAFNVSFSATLRVSDNVSTRMLRSLLFTPSISMNDTVTIAPSVKFTYTVSLTDVVSATLPAFVSVGSSLKLEDSAYATVVEKRYPNLLPVIFIIMLILIAIMYKKGE